MRSFIQYQFELLFEMRLGLQTPEKDIKLV